MKTIIVHNNKIHLPDENDSFALRIPENDGFSSHFIHDDLYAAIEQQLQCAQHVYNYIDKLMDKPDSYKFLGEKAGFVLERLLQIFPGIEP